LTEDTRDEEGPTEEKLSAAAYALRSGRVVAIPTDTVYGLAVDPRCVGATNALFVLKERPHSLTLPVLVADYESARALSGPSGFGRVATRIARKLWPGAVTLVVERAPGLGWDLGDDDSSIGLRCPDHTFARELCRRVGALATTSANRHGRAPLTTAEQVHREFGDTAMVVNGGELSGHSSTVVDVRGRDPVCLRRGAVSWEEILAAADGDDSSRIDRDDSM